MSCEPKKCVDVHGGTQFSCENRPVKISPVNVRNRVVAKIPVVLAEIDVQIDVFSHITLPEEALEIKDIQKKLKLVQCRLIQSFPKKQWDNDWEDDWEREPGKEDGKDHDKHKHGKFKLFLEGFVRKNIQYAVVDCKNKYGVCGDIRHCTVDVPFSCVTTIERFNGSPPLPIVLNSKDEFEFFRSAKLPPNFPEKDRLLSGDLSEFNQCSFEYFNELPFCELIASRICEHDEFIHPEHIKGAPFEERTFREFSEKMIIDVTLKVLQNQQVYVPPFQWKKEV